MNQLGIRHIILSSSLFPGTRHIILSSSLFPNNWYKFIHEWWEQEWMVQVFAMPNLFTADRWVIIGTYNTDVLSTKAVNDLVMILYYDACYAHRSSSSTGFHHTFSYRSGGTCCSHTEWTRLLGMCPFLSTLLFLILDPNHQEHFHWLIHALNWLWYNF